MYTIEAFDLFHGICAPGEGSEERGDEGSQADPRGEEWEGRQEFLTRSPHRRAGGSARVGTSLTAETAATIGPEPLRRDAGALALAGKGGYAVRIGGRSAKCGLIIPT
jgi:hypothetical protein